MVTQHVAVGLTVGRSRAWLALIWLLGCSPLVLIVIVQIVLGRYADGFEAPIGWLSTLIFPTWSIILAVLTVGKTRAASLPVHHVSLFYITVTLSIIYILCLYAILFLGVLAPGGLALALQESCFYMGFFQSFAIGSLGKFFLESRE